MLRVRTGVGVGHTRIQSRARRRACVGGRRRARDTSMRGTVPSCAVSHAAMLHTLPPHPATPSHHASEGPQSGSVEQRSEGAGVWSTCWPRAPAPPPRASSPSPRPAPSILNPCTLDPQPLHPRPWTLDPRSGSGNVKPSSGSVNGESGRGGTRWPRALAPPRASSPWCPHTPAPATTPSSQRRPSPPLPLFSPPSPLLSAQHPILIPCLVALTCPMTLNPKP
eukprot:3938380-Rhodomonas_salina.1